MALKWWTLLVSCIGVFMLLLDIHIVTVALPSIEEDLDASLSDLQWVLDAYALSLAALTIISGSLGDRIGRRLVFVGGMAIFAYASLLCAIAPDPLVLNLARGLQGVGGAAMFGTTLALIAQEFGPDERAKAFAIWGATVGVASAVGPLVGGVIVEALGWQWIFYINIPIGIVAITLALTRVRETREPVVARLDWAGFVTLGPAMFLLVLGILRGNSEGWSSVQVVGSLGAAAVLLLVFVVVEIRGASPMFDLRLFRIPTFTGASLAVFAVSATLFTMLAYFVLYLQNVLGHSPIEAGAGLLPITLLAFVFGPIEGKLRRWVSSRVIIGVGLAYVGFGFVALTAVEQGSDWTRLIPGFVLLGIGGGLVNPAVAEAAVAVLPPGRAGMLTGINNTFRQMGVAVGIAALGAVLEQRVVSRLADALRDAPAAVRANTELLGEAAASGRVEAAFAVVPRESQAEVAEAADRAFVATFTELATISAVIAFAGAVLAFALIRQQDFVEPAEGGGAAG